MDNKQATNDTKLSYDYEVLCAQYGKDLVDTELNIESESQRLGISRLTKAIERDKVNTGAGKILLANAIPELSKAIAKWLDDANNKGNAGRKHSAACLVELGDTDMVAYITLSTLFTSLLTTSSTIGKQQTFTSVALKIASALEDEFRFKRVFDSLQTKADKASAKHSLDKRIGIRYKRAFMRALENECLEGGYLEAWQKWTTTSRVNVGSKLIELAAEITGLFELLLLAEDDTSNRSYYIVLKDGVTEALETENRLLIDVGFINRPMVIPPKPWTGPFEGGYYIDLKSPNPFVRLPRSKLVKLYGDVDMPNVYAAVNAIQATAWRVNTKVLDVAKAISNWRNIPECLDFPSNEPADKPIRPSEADDNDEIHTAWKGAMLRYYQNDNTRKGRRLGVNAVIALADEYRDYKAIYFPHNVDFRGRVYPLTVLSPQGNDFNKALLTFAHGKPVGKEGAKWLAFHGANCFGLDKKPLEERFAWPYENQAFIEAIASDPINNTDWMSTDSPWEFLAWCFEWVEYLKKGDSFESTLPIAFDGSCSGLQHYSAMLRDPIGGNAVNLVPHDSVQDVYRLVCAEVNKVVEDDLVNGTADTECKDKDGSSYTKLGTKYLAKEWLDFGIDRNVTKHPVMTLAYGAKQFGFKDQVLKYNIYPAISKDSTVFKRPHQAAAYMAEKIWIAVNKVVVKAMEAMEWLQDTSALLASQQALDGNPIATYWVTPAGFPVQQAYEKMTSKRVTGVLGGSITIREPQTSSKPITVKKDGTISIYPRVREPQKGVLDSRKQRQGIAPNFVHSMDASHLMLTVLACASKGVDSFAMIHDSYGTVAGDAEIMYHTVREVFVKTYSENDVLRDFYEQVKLQLPTKALSKLKEPPVRGDLDLANVLNSKYAFS